MRLISIFAAILLAASPVAADSRPAGSEDRRSLEALAHGVDELWDKGDAESLSGLFAEEGNLRLTGMTEPVTGRKALRSFFEQSFARREPGLRHVTLVEQVELPSSDLMVSDGRVRIERRNADGSWALVREFANNNVAVREKGRWKLVAVRGHALPAAR